MASYIDPTTVFDPAPDQAPPAEWGDALNGNDQYFYERIERVISHTVLSLAGTTIASGTLPTVPNGWQLRIAVRARHASTTGQDGLLRFNGDAGLNYARQAVYSTDTTPAALEQTAVNGIGVVNCGNESVNRWSIGNYVVLDYLGSGHKAVLGSYYNPANLATQLVAAVAGLWLSTAAISSVSVTANTGNLAAGSSLTVLATPVPA